VVRLKTVLDAENLRLPIRIVGTGKTTGGGSITRVPAAQIEKQVFAAIQSVIASKRSNEDFGALSLLGLSGRTTSSTEKPCQALSSQEDVLDAIERVTIGAKQIEIRLSESVAVDGTGRKLTIPWIPPSPYQRREIVQGKGEPRSPIRPMRVRARAVFAESLRNAHRWLDDLVMDPNQTIELIAAREGKSERSIRMTLSLALLSPRPSSSRRSRDVCHAGSELSD
jgi:hypothetical protein